jgi:molecular chaperone DnaK (HSP70)
MTADNKLLGSLKLTGIQRGPRGSAKINVKLSIDANGMLSIKASEDNSKISKDLLLTLSNNRADDDEVKRMKQEADEQKDRDAEKLKLVQDKNDCENIIYDIEQKIGNIKDKDKKEEFNKRLNESKEKLETDTVTCLEQLRALLSDVANHAAANAKNADSDKTDTEDSKGDKVDKDDSQTTPDDKK